MPHHKQQATTFRVSESTKITNKMTSFRYILLLILALLAISFTIYFAQKHYFHGKESLKGNETEQETAKEIVNLDGHTEESEEKSVDGAHGQIEGSLYLKSILKNMTCERRFDDDRTLTLSCCGNLLLPNSNENHNSCLLVEAQKVFDSFDYLFRIKFLVDNRLIGSRQSIGVFPPTNTCLAIYQGIKLCVDFNFVPLDNGEANESAFNTCALMIISSKSRKSWETAPEIKDLDVKTEYLPCDTEKGLILQRSTTKFATIMRVYLSTIEEEHVNEKETVENSGVQASLFVKSVAEDLVCDIEQESSNSITCCGHFSIPKLGKKSKGCLIFEAKNNSNDPEMAYTYGMKITVEGDEIGYTNTKGLLIPGTKCFEIGASPGIEMCVDISFLSFNTGFIDDSIFKSCSLITARSKSNSSWESLPNMEDVLGETTLFPCNNTETDILQKTGSFITATARIFMNSSVTESVKPKANDVIVVSDYQHPPYGGAIYLKSDMKDMKCELTYMGSTNDHYALTCYGILSLNDEKKHTGAFLVKSMRKLIQKVNEKKEKIEENEYFYEVSLTIDNREIISFNFTGFPPAPSKDCFMIPGHPELKECLALEELVTDEESTENHYQSCKLMVFNSHKEVSKYGSYHLSAAIRRLEDLQCSTGKDDLLEKSGRGADVLMISIENATDEDRKEWGIENPNEAPKKQVGDTQVSQGILDIINSGFSRLFG